MSLNLAIVGATGAVGREILAVLEQRSVPVAKLRLFASARSAGGTITFRGTKIPIEALPEGEPKARTFAGLDAVLLSAGATISRRIIPAIVRDGVLAIDNSSAFREDPKIPLVIPELNGGRIAEALAAGAAP